MVAANGSVRECTWSHSTEVRRALRVDQVANLSVQLFGTDSRYYGQAGVSPAACQNRY